MVGRQFGCQPFFCHTSASVVAAQTWQKNRVKLKIWQQSEQHIKPFLKNNFKAIYKNAFRLRRCGKNLRLSQFGFNRSFDHLLQVKISVFKTYIVTSTNMRERSVVGFVHLWRWCGFSYSSSSSSTDVCWHEGFKQVFNSQVVSLMLQHHTASKPFTHSWLSAPLETLQQMEDLIVAVSALETQPPFYQHVDMMLWPHLSPAASISLSEQVKVTWSGRTCP